MCFLHVIDGHGLWSCGWFLFTCLFFSFFSWGLTDVGIDEAARLWPGVASNRVPLFWQPARAYARFQHTGRHGYFRVCGETTSSAFSFFASMTSSRRETPSLMSRPHPDLLIDSSPCTLFARYQRRTVPWTVPASVLSIRACQPNAKVCPLVRWITWNFSDPLTR